MRRTRVRRRLWMRRIRVRWLMDEASVESRE
jgi:hypothetical protein